MDLYFYRSHSAYSSVNDFVDVIQDIPKNVEAICSFVQNNLIHSYWLEHYGVEIDNHTRLTEMQIRYANEILITSESKAGATITEIHRPQDRVVGVCRDFSLLLCSIFREKDIPARIRCGFSKYLTPDRFEDHWICEYWQEADQRWVMVDAQLDDVHSDILDLKFDRYDVPKSEFIYAGEAWRLCREQKEGPSKFGIFNLNGLSFIKGNIVRDLYALRKVELMAWDTGWGILKNSSQAISSEREMNILDELAILSYRSDEKGSKNAIAFFDEIKFPSGWKLSQAPTIAELLAEHSEG
ncbi:transglutaminase domain-containing protein [Reinekea sp.]|jgi:hypothetical protein|uniref:transglutaminase domain-containing protein n=1 Tax=Reinekea sp. TaxID=1970455 RepID=UPI003988CAC6